MNKYNGYFEVGDQTVQDVAGFEIPDTWWSRGFEYAWALSFPLAANWVVADMGAGGQYRPLKDGLAKKVRAVTAIDADEKLFETPKADNVLHICSTFEKLHEALYEDELFDAIFCISVLEDVVSVSEVLGQFKRCLKPSGKMYITFDSPFDIHTPCEFYPGMNMSIFLDALRDNDLDFVGNLSMVKGPNTLVHSQFNLCVFHAVLEYKCL